MYAQKKISKEIKQLRFDIASVRSLLIGLIGEDTEGHCRAEFVKEVKRAAAEKAEKNVYRFEGKGSLLRALEAV